MSLLNKALATARFDFARTLTPSRISVVVVLGLFPPVMMAINAAVSGSEFATPVIGVTVMMVGLLALLLWATPLIYQELEGKTWTYVAVRPQGKLALVFGKYLVAVCWTMIVCTAAMTLSVAVVTLADPVADQLRMWLVFLVMIVLAAFAYGAIYLLIGVLFHRRAMVVAVGYSIGMEMIVAQVPAVINQFTMRHHLTALTVKWLEFDLISDPVVQQSLGVHEPSWQNIGVLVVTPVLLLGVTVAIILNREYITTGED